MLISKESARHLREDVKIPNHILRDVSHNELIINNGDLLTAQTLNILFLKLYCRLYDVTTASSEEHDFLLNRLSNISSQVKGISDIYVYVSRLKNEIDYFISRNRTSPIRSLGIYQREPIQNALKFIDNLSIMDDLVVVKNKTDYRSIFGIDFIFGIEYEISYYSSINGFASCTLWFNFGANKEMNFFTTTLFAAKYSIAKIEFFKDNTTYELKEKSGSDEDYDYILTKYRDTIEIDFVKNENISSIFITIYIEETIDSKNIFITGNSGYSITKEYQQISAERIFLEKNIDYAILTNKDNPIYNYLTIGTKNVFLKNINPLEPEPIIRGFYYINKIPDIISLTPKPSTPRDIKFILDNGDIIYPLDNRDGLDGTVNKLFNEYLVLDAAYQRQAKLFEKTKIKIEYKTDLLTSEYSVIPYLIIEALSKHDTSKIGIRLNNQATPYKITDLKNYYEKRRLGTYTISKKVIEIYENNEVLGLEYPKPMLFYSQITTSSGGGEDSITVPIKDYHVPGQSHAIATYKGLELPLEVDDNSTHNLIVYTKGIQSNKIVVFYEPIGINTQLEIVSNIKDNHETPFEVYPENGIFDLKLDEIPIPKIVMDEFYIKEDAFVNKLHENIVYRVFLSQHPIRTMELSVIDNILRVYMEDSSYSNPHIIYIYDNTSTGFLTTNSKDVYISNSPIIIAGM